MLEISVIGGAQLGILHVSLVHTSQPTSCEEFVLILDDLLGSVLRLLFKNYLGFGLAGEYRLRCLANRHLGNW